MSTKITRYLKIIALLGLMAVLVRSGVPSNLFERLFVLAVYLFFFLSYLLRLVLLFFGLYAVYRTLYRLVNEQVYGKLAA